METFLVRYGSEHKLRLPFASERFLSQVLLAEKLNSSAQNDSFREISAPTAVSSFNLETKQGQLQRQGERDTPTCSDTKTKQPIRPFSLRSQKNSPPAKTKKPTHASPFPKYHRHGVVLLPQIRRM